LLIQKFRRIFLDYFQQQCWLHVTDFGLFYFQWLDAY
jgi:hypothetical protein